VISCTLSHVTLVVESLETTLRRLEALPSHIGTIENQPTEGTREVYVGDNGASALLLLCEPTDPKGPYGRALARRGPGLHHLGLSVPRLEDYLLGLAGSGWYVLPQSVAWLARGNAWLARPGVHALLEISQMPDPVGEPFVSDVEIPMVIPDERLIACLGLPGHPLRVVRAVPGVRTCLTVCGQRLDMRALASR